MAYNAPQIVSLVKSGKGPADMFAGSHQAASMAKLHEEIANDMRVLQGAMQEHWTGDAAGQAYSGAGPLVQASQVSGQHLQQAQTLYSGQGSSYSNLQNKVNSVADLGTRPQNDWVSGTPFSFLSNRADQINQWDQKAQQVVDSYNVYHGQSTDNSSKWPAQYGELGLPPGGAGIKPTVGAPGPGQPSSGKSGGPGGRWNGGRGGSTEVAGGTGGPTGSVRPPAHIPPSSFSGTTPAGHTPNSPGDPGSGGFVPGMPVGMYGNPSSGAGGFGPGAGGFGAGFGPGGGGYGSGGGGGAGSRVSGGFGPGSGGRSSGAGAIGGASASGAGMPGEPGAGGRAAGTASPGGRAGALGAGGMGHGSKGEDSEDAEHQRPSYLLEPDPDDALVGKLPQSVPPVIGL
jgi:hypothetical protein